MSINGRKSIYIIAIGEDHHIELFIEGEILHQSSRFTYLDLDILVQFMDLGPDGLVPTLSQEVGLFGQVEVAAQVLRSGRGRVM